MKQIIPLLVLSFSFLSTANAADITTCFNKSSTPVHLDDPIGTEYDVDEVSASCFTNTNDYLIFGGGAMQWDAI